MPVSQQSGVDLALEEEVDRRSQGLLVQIGIVVMILENSVEAIGNDLLGSCLADIAAFDGIEAGRLVGQIRFYAHCHFVAGEVFPLHYLFEIDSHSKRMGGSDSKSSSETSSQRITLTLASFQKSQIKIMQSQTSTFEECEQELR